MRFCAKGFNPNVLSRLCNSDRGLPTRPPVVRGESGLAQGYKWVMDPDPTKIREPCAILGQPFQRSPTFWS